MVVVFDVVGEFEGGFCIYCRIFVVIGGCVVVVCVRVLVLCFGGKVLKMMWLLMVMVLFL